MRFVFEEMKTDESRKQACARMAPKLNVNPTTLYNWVKAATPKAQIQPPANSLDALKTEIAALKKENKELNRANEILKAASAFFGAETSHPHKSQAARPER